MHNLLRNVDVRTSQDMQTILWVRQGEHTIKASMNQAYLKMKREGNSFRIVLPQQPRERRSCLRSQLPKSLVKELGIFGSSAEKQIYRFINELDMGTDELLATERIPHADSWLTKTERLPQPAEPDVSDIPTANGLITLPAPPSLSATVAPQTDSEYDEGAVVISSTQTRLASYARREVYVQIPATVNHEVDAPEYWKVLEHIRRQARGVVWRNRQPEQTLTSTNEYIAFLNDLTRSRNGSTDLSSYPELFGSDDLVKHRIGAAGELFVRRHYSRRKIGSLIRLIGLRSSQDPHWRSNRSVGLEKQDSSLRPSHQRLQQY